MSRQETFDRAKAATWGFCGGGCARKRLKRPGNRVDGGTRWLDL